MGQAILDIYRFWVDIPGLGTLQMYPQNSKIEWEFARKPGYRFHQMTLKTKLIFQDNPSVGIYDFTNLYNLERTGRTCERVELRVDIFLACDGEEGTWVEGWYKALLPLSQGDWNASRCRVEIGTSVNDAYACIISKWKKAINMFDYGDPPITISPFEGVIQYEECGPFHYTKTFPLGGISGIEAWVTDFFWEHLIADCLEGVTPPYYNFEGPWTLVKHTHFTSYTFDIDFSGPFPGSGDTVTVNILIKSKWAREFVAGVTMPSGIGWEAVTGGWARRVPVIALPELNQSTPEGEAALEQEWGSDNFNLGILARAIIPGVDDFGVTTLTNAKAMASVLQDWFALCGLTLVSNFFDIAPDNTNPDNVYYERAAEDCQALVLIQVTDVARLDETQSATRAEFMPKELIDTLKMMYNTDISLDSTGLIAYLEHASFFVRTVNLDLTLEQFVGLIDGWWRYSYDQLTLPYREVFGFSAESNIDFDGYPIEYDNICVNTQDEETRTEWTQKSTKFLTNITHVYGNKDFFDSKEILIVATDQFDVIQSRPGAITGITRMNGAAALAYLMPRYHDYGRPFKKGFINKIETPLFASLRQKKQTPISLPFTREDLVNNFQGGAGLVKTQLAAAEIDRATFEDPKQNLTLNLKAK